MEFVPLTQWLLIQQKNRLLRHLLIRLQPFPHLPLHLRRHQVNVETTISVQQDKHVAVNWSFLDSASFRDAVFMKVVFAVINQNIAAQVTILFVMLIKACASR